MKVTLSVRTIDAIPVNPDREVFVWDDKLAGFGLRIKPKGIPSFFIQYRNAGGTSRRHTLGRLGSLTPDKARKLAKTKLLIVAEGGDPAAERTKYRNDTTVRELCDAYLEEAKLGLIPGKGGKPKKASTLYFDKGRIERHIVPLLGANTKVRDLTTPDFNRMVRDIVAGKTAADIKTGPRGRAIVRGGPVAASRTAGLAGSIMTFAVSRGDISVNPTRGVNRPKDKRRKVRLTVEQYREVGKALAAALADGESEVGIDVIRTLALTGCRPVEVTTMKVSEVDVKRQCLRPSDNKEQDDYDIRPIGKAALKVIKGGIQSTIGDHASTGNEYVFPGNTPEQWFKNLRGVWERIRDRTKLPTNFTPNGFRHAFASIASDLGYVRSTVKVMLGHAVSGTTEGYVHHLDPVLIAAADRVSGYISDAMEGRPPTGQNPAARKASRKRSGGRTAVNA